MIDNRMYRRWAMSMLFGGVLFARNYPTVLSAADRKAFRAWFTWLAELMYFTDAGNLPREVSDCSGLLRFAYREALRPHSGQWAHSLGLEMLPALPELRASTQESAVFQVKDGGRRQFADAENLMRHNSFLVTRDVRAAQSGDLLFYRQWTDRQPWHSMVYLGPSRFEAARDALVVYHTGPLHGTAGEVRRPRVEELIRHPEPRWRPVAGNSNFLGIYRWNLLRESD
jgi:uncharacterized protein YfaT (DUF1175 family)